MLVVSYSDFFANPSRYKQEASVSGLKILPEKKQKKISRSLQKKLDALDAVVGLIPSEVNAEALMEERRMSK
ncbi:MAG: hypothetical protein J6W60_01525 [Treponema sp.]|nr:hypothetical protein [Treponema sp.]MBP5751525.1 hypothetical protein [Treponema sp.]